MIAFAFLLSYERTALPLADWDRILTSKRTKMQRRPR